MSGISQEFTTFGLKNSKSGKFLTYTRYEIPLLKIVFKQLDTSEPDFFSFKGPIWQK